MVASSDRTLRSLTSLLGLELSLVVLSALAATVASALALAPFFVVAQMAAAIYAEPPRLELVRSLALVAALLLVVRFTLVAAANMLAHLAAYRVLHKLRVRLVHKLGAVPLSFFGEHGSAALKKTLMEDVGAIETFVAHHFPDAVAALAVPLFAAGALFWVDVRMALASLAMAPLAVFAMSVAMRNVGAANAEWNELQERTNRALLEYLRGIHVAKTFGVSAARFGELSSAIHGGISWMEGFMRTNGRGYSAFATLIGSSVMVLLPLGGYLFHQGSLSLESLVLFLVLGPQLLMSAMRLMFAWGNVDRIRSGLARVRSVLEAEELAARGTTEHPRHHGLSFRNVNFRYEERGRDVLCDVSFDAPAGKVTALVGPSGAGKSTLVRLVPRLSDVGAGAVSLGGVDVRALPLEQLLARVSMVFQEVFLFHGTVRENLLLARPTASDAELVDASRAARAHEFISALPNGYDTMLGERGARLSGGERQRLSIARALLKDAPALLLDEATSFADPQSEARIQEALRVACRDRTVLVIAHRLSTIASADHIVVLDAGRVVQQGTHAELLAHCSLYAELWRKHEEAREWSLPSTVDSAAAQEVA